MCQNSIFGEDMKVYFSCSVTGGRNEENVYAALVNAMLKAGYEVPTAHLSTPEVMEMEKVVKPGDIFKRDMRWLEESDVIVAEVSTPSHGVGYEIAQGLMMNKPVFCCYQHGKRVSMILTGNSHPKITLFEYDQPEKAVREVLKYLSSIST